MERSEFLERKKDKTERLGERRSSGISVWGIAGGIALAGLAALVIISLPDIKRYIKISTM